MITHVTMESTRQLQRIIKMSENYSLLWTLLSDKSLLGLKFDKFEVACQLLNF